MTPAATLITWEPTSGGLTGYFARGVLRLSRAIEVPTSGGPPRAVGWYVRLLRKGDDVPSYLVPPTGQGEQSRWGPGGGKHYFLSVGDALRAASSEARALMEGGSGEDDVRTP